MFTLVTRHLACLHLNIYTLVTWHLTCLHLNIYTLVIEKIQKRPLRNSDCVPRARI
jgi:hypothetical protein